MENDNTNQTQNTHYSKEEGILSEMFNNRFSKIENTIKALEEIVRELYKTKTSTDYVSKIETRDLALLHMHNRFVEFVENRLKEEEKTKLELERMKTHVNVKAKERMIQILHESGAITKLSDGLLEWLKRSTILNPKVEPTTKSNDSV